jgi:hypothetical protein
MMPPPSILHNKKTRKNNMELARLRHHHFVTSRSTLINQPLRRSVPRYQINSANFNSRRCAAPRPSNR